MKNKKGQALVEFVLLIPIIMMVLFIVIDFASIFYERNRLEGVLNNVSEMIKEDEPSDKIKKAIDDDSISYSLKSKNGMTTITITKKVKLVTPFSGTFFDNPYTVSTKRIILYE